MNIEFATADLARLETDPAFDAGFPPAVVKRYRGRLDDIRSAVDERDFYALKSMHFEKLRGERQHQHSLRINIQYRLILEIIVSENQKIIRIVEITNHYESLVSANWGAS